jgi:hypothetical protein
MPAGNTPTVSLAGTTVTVSISQISVAGQLVGVLGGGYAVKRYPANGGAAVIPPSGTCSTSVTGSAATLTCTETNLPRGDWKYTVSPTLFQWTSAESAASTTIVLAPNAPTGLTATAAPAGAINLSWTAGTGATGYNVYRRATAGANNFATPVNGATPVGGTTYSDTTAASGTAYNYVVRSVVIGSAGQQIESGNSNESAAATSDATAPTGVTLNAVATPLTDTITLSGTATDTVSGVNNVAFQYKLSSGSTWLAACTDNTTPYSCTVDTNTITDGLYDFRALATDGVGNQTASTIQTNRRIDNTAPTANATNPGTYVRGIVSLGGTATDAGSGIASMTLNGRGVGAGAWVTVCTSTTSPLTCTYDTATIPDGAYEVQLVVTDNAGNTTTTPTVTPINVDNTAPTVTMTDPGTPLSGTDPLSSTTADASGIASVQYQYKTSAGTVWTNACLASTTPFTCNFNTASVADGLYDFRAIATDLAGNQTTSASVTNRRIDNTAPPGITVTNPGSPLTGTVTINTSTPTDTGGSGVASVAIQRSPAGAGTWTTICTDTTATYSCSLDTTTLADGLFDFRAIATDNAGNSTTSATVANRQITNPPTAVDIQTANGGTLGRPDSGDTITYTFSEPMRATSFLAGWTGASTAVSVRLTQAATDTMTIFNAANTAQLPFGSVTIGTGHVTASAVLNATMVMSGNTIVVTLGTLVSGTVATSAANVTMVWTPSAAALDVAGNAMSTTARTETGAADREF